MKKNNIKLSVIIITRNEEFNIGRCIESVIRDSTGISTEIIMVDTESTDKTIDIAKKFPIQVISTPCDKYRSPSAARFIGTKNSSGEFILFLDADVIVIKGWIKKAIEYFSEKELAGVRGRLCNVFPGEKLNMKHIDKRKPGYNRVLGGQASMYRRKALEQCGTFHPYLKGEEERELYYRLKSKGWKLRIVDVPMAYHLNKSKNESEIDEKAGYFKGVGQILRENKFASISRDLFYAHKKIFAEIMLTYLLVILCVIFIIMNKMIFFYGLLILTIISLTALIIIKGPYKVYLYLRSRFLTSLNIFKGIMLGLDDPKTYTKKVRAKYIKK